MKCEVCGEKAIEGKVICSEKCNEIRKKAFSLINKYFPTHGCDNCWGDLHRGCSEQCKREFSQSLEFGRELWFLIHSITK